LEEKNATLQQETSQLREQLNTSKQQWNEVSSTLSEIIGSVDPLILKKILEGDANLDEVFDTLKSLAENPEAHASINIDDEQLILRIKEFQGEILFRSWIDAVSDRNVISVQHLKSTTPKLPGSYTIAADLWGKTRETVEKKIAAGTVNSIELQNAKINFINKLWDIDRKYFEQAEKLFHQYLIENAYEKPKVSTSYVLNRQFRKGGLHTISFKVSPVDKDTPWALLVELVRKSNTGEEVLKSFEINSSSPEQSSKESFIVQVTN
jgi:hypothetical protein